MIKTSCFAVLKNNQVPAYIAKQKKISFSIYAKKILEIDYPLSSTSNLERLGPAITPTTAKRTIERTPTAAAEGLKPPKAIVDSKFMKKANFGMD